MKHTLHKCDDENCHICPLSLCTVCGGAEGSLPTECPGSRMPEKIEKAVYAQTLDFKDNRWYTPKLKESTKIKVQFEIEVENYQTKEQVIDFVHRNLQHVSVVSLKEI